MNIKINKKAPQELMRSYGTLLAGHLYIQSNFNFIAYAFVFIMYCLKSHLHI